VSAGAGIWKDVLLKAVHIPARKVAVAPTEAAPGPAISQPITSLVRQVFFPAARVQRTQVLFAAADAETRISAIGEQVGRVLAEMSGTTVALVEPCPKPLAEMKKASNSSAGAEWWRRYSSQIADRLWRVPSVLINSGFRLTTQRPTENPGLPFDFVLFVASVADSETPLFCSVCEGAMLVLTAHRTRRETALRAKEQLLQYNAQLLGTVLDGRTFPVPEAIYQRL